MSLPNERDEPVRGDRHGAHGFGHRDDRHEGEVERAAFEFLKNLTSGNESDRKSHVRSELGKALDDGHAEGVGRVHARGDAKGPVHRGGRKRLGGTQGLRLGEHAPHEGLQTLRPGRGDEMRIRSHEQRVAQRFAQSRENAARSGLSDAALPGGVLQGAQTKRRFKEA